MPTNKRKIPEVNASSQADIAFMLLIFFLVATSMNTDSGIPRMLPPLPDEKQKTEDMDIRERNLLTVFINAHNQIMVAGKRVSTPEEVKEKALEYILNPMGDENMPEKEVKEFELPDKTKKTYGVSQCIISLQNDRGTDYGKYLEVQDALMSAFREVRDDLSKKWYAGKSFDQLTDEESEVITKAVPLKISESEPRNVGGKK